MTQRFWSSRAPTATVVLPELMPKEELVKSMMDVVSHEFFHIVTHLAFILKKSKILIIMTQNVRASMDV
jgi:hypothetical protein